jgi:hypothetical protein
MDWYPGVPFRSRARTILKRADWLEFSFLVFLMFSGLGLLLSGARPGSTSALIPDGWESVWLIMLTLGATMAIVGIFWLWKRVDSILLESLGDLAVGIAVFVYGISIIVWGIKTGNVAGGVLLAGPIIMLLGYGWIWKWWTLSELLKTLRERQAAKDA